MDEATSALDVSVQKTIIELITKLQREKNITIGFICHDIALIEQCAHQIAVMYLGNVVEVLPGGQLSKDAVHPYTRALMGSVFDINMDFSKSIENLEGEAAKPAGAAGRLPVPGSMYQMYGDLQKRSSANGQPYIGSSGRLSSVYRKRTEIET